MFINKFTSNVSAHLDYKVGVTFQLMPSACRKAIKLAFDQQLTLVVVCRQEMAPKADQVYNAMFKQKSIFWPLIVNYKWFLEPLEPICNQTFRKGYGTFTE